MTVDADKMSEMMKKRFSEESSRLKKCDQEISQWENPKWNFVSELVEERGEEELILFVSRG